jgi:hypothetical protein
LNTTEDVSNVIENSERTIQYYQSNDGSQDEFNGNFDLNKFSDLKK